ncbi:MAG: hypothetical protein MUF54_25160, partial [Polyangiaceae bacterium]|nr:hypothetical protein [Polyangiaceae bacterium]
SNHFVRADILYEQLVGRGVEVVGGKNFIMHSLGGHDAATAEPRLLTDIWRPDEPIEPRPAFATLPAAVVYYNGLMVVDTLRTYDPRGKDVVMVGSERFVRDDSFDPHFLVYLNDAARRR